MIERQKDWITGRYRTVRAPDPLEQQIQISLIQRLKWQCRRDDVTYLHPPNGGLRTKTEAALLRAMGVLPGASDLLFMVGPHTLWLELKARGRKLTDEQVWFGERVRTVHGHYFEMADTIDAAVAVLQRYEILP